MSQVTVRVEHHEYPIYIDSNLFYGECQLSSFIQSDQVLVISNDTVSDLYFQTVRQHLSDFDVNLFTMPDGEEFKSFDTFQKIIEQLITLNYRRNATVIALGGGVVGDISGFAAACYQRGIPFIQIPTTLLSMVDSSVGGKTAINHPLAKNMVGAFYQPQAVFADLSFLASLPQREFSAGMAEVIKYGLIYDFALFEYIEKNYDQILAKETSVLQYLIARCCEIKAEVVNQDEKEQGIRGILNLGHTFGHAIEKAGKYQRYLHGEAVAIGTCMAFELAVAHNVIERDYLARIENVFQVFQLPCTLQEKYSAEQLLSTMRHDKKNQTSKIRLVIPTGNGEVEITDKYTEQEIIKVIRCRLPDYE